MQEKTIQKILNDEETLDLVKAAEAILDDKKREEKRNRPRVKKTALQKWREKQKAADEAFRQRVAKVWNKNKQ